jgi:hypothetical protein
VGKSVHARVCIIALGSLAIPGCRTDVVGLLRAGATETGTTGEETTADTDVTESDWSSGDECALGPPGTGPCPPECSAGCEDGICTVRCDSLSQCAGKEVVCPEDWPCVVRCVDEGSCQDSNLHCGSRGCHVICDASWSCENTTIHCGDGPCEAVCIEGGGSLHQKCETACRCSVEC